MDNLLALFDQGAREFTARVNAVRPDQWSASTPCRDWDVTALVDHVVDEHRWFPPLMGGHDLETAQKLVEAQADASGGDRKEDWAAAATASQQAIAEEGAIERTVQLSRGPTPATQYVMEMLFDLVVHGWDLGQAIDYPEPLPDSLVQAVWPVVEGMKDELAGSGMFDPPVDVPADAPPLDKLIGLTGRRPS